MKIIDFMLDHIGKPVNLGFRSSFVYCDIVSEDIVAELANLSAHWLAHEIDLLQDGIEAHDRLVARWISRHMPLDNPEPKCPPGSDKEDQDILL